MDTKVKKMLSGFLYILLVVILIFSVALVLPVYRKYLKVQEDKAESEKNLQAVKEEHLTLIREVHDLEHDRFAVEKVAREKYKLIRKTEQVLIYK